MRIWISSNQEYALVMKLIHWLSAVTIVALFALGLWMMSLDYSHLWYQKAPEWHVAVGFFLVMLTLLRLLYRIFLPMPKALPGPRWQIVVATTVHWLFYGLLLAMLVTGYLIVTAKGEPLIIFNWFALPSLVTGIDNLEDTMGDLHEWFAYVIIGLSVLHSGAALKHHFIDRDGTLKRMITKI